MKFFRSILYISIDVSANNQLKIRFLGWSFHYFIFYKQGEWTGIIDIPTKLAPREISILCRKLNKILLKKGKN